MPNASAACDGADSSTNASPVVAAVSASREREHGQQGADPRDLVAGHGALPSRYSAGNTNSQTMSTKCQ
jgi:hypothetical protein